MIPLVLFVAAFGVRAVVGVAFPGPAYPDSYYYVHVAQNLASGDGMTVAYLWNLADLGRLPLGSLPVPANGLWMPMTELIQLPTVLLLGPTSIAAGVPFWLLGALAAPLTYLIGRDAGFGRSAAAVAGGLVAVPAALTPFVSQPDSFAPFMLLGALALWLCARGMAGDRRAFIVGGVVVGLAALTRADGMLLGVPYALAFARELVPGHQKKIGWAAALGCAGLFVVIISPWVLRQVDVFGSLAPSTGRLLWLTEYQQLFSLGNPPTIDAWLAKGPAWIAASTIGAVVAAIGTYALLPLALVLAPFLAVGAWYRRRDSNFSAFFVYTVVLVSVMALLFPVVVTHGTFIHSAAALVPHSFLLVVVGIAEAVRWAAARRPTWSTSSATRAFMAGALATAAITGATQTVLVVDKWTRVRTAHQELAGSLRSAPAADRFMAADPGAFTYLTGRQGVVTPADELQLIEETMRKFDVRWLILERASIVPALEPLLAGALRPSWLSRPIAVVGAAGAVFAVCFDQGDARCSS